MADTNTSNMTQTTTPLVEVEVGASVGSWGGKLNTNFVRVVAEANAISALIGVVDSGSPPAGGSGLAKAVQYKLDLAGGTMTGLLEVLTAREKFTALGSCNSATNLDLSLSDAFTATITGDVAFTVTNVPSSGSFVKSFLIQLTNAGAHAVTFTGLIKWPDGAAPTFTVSGIDYVGLVSFNGGFTWAAFAALNVH